MNREAERRENDKLERQRQELLRRELEEKEKEAQAMAPMTKRGSSDNFGGLNFFYYCYQ